MIPKVVASEIGGAQRNCRNTILVSKSKNILVEDSWKAARNEVIVL